MSHRGGCGCEVNTGDGAGILVGMPDSFYRRVLRESQIELGPLNSYGTGIVFTPKGDTNVEAIKEIFEIKVKQLGMRIIGWRKIETG
jgi:glutamate synthase domain-containing protein 1